MVCLNETERVSLKYETQIMCLWPLVLINLGCQLDTPGEGYSQMKSCLYQIVLWAYLWGLFLIAN